jgi:hypothetical protein
MTDIDRDAPLVTALPELWFVIHDAETGKVMEHGNAFGEEEYASEVGRRSSPSMRVPGKIDDVFSYEVDILTKELRLIPVTPYVPTEADVNRERDRRIGAGFAFSGKLYQSREKDIARINSQAALAAVVVDAFPEGDLRWSDPNKDFVFISADNSRVPMDAATMVALGRAASVWGSSVTLAARSIKDRMIKGEALDPADDDLWPSSSGE